MLGILLLSCTIPPPLHTGHTPPGQCASGQSVQTHEQYEGEGIMLGYIHNIITCHEDNICNDFQASKL